MNCGHTKASKLEIGYGYAYTSCWLGLGVTYSCKRCSEVLWFEDYSPLEYEKELNDEKRKENIKYKPKRNGPHPKSKRDIQLTKQLKIWISNLSNGK